MYKAEKVSKSGLYGAAFTVAFDLFFLGINMFKAIQMLKNKIISVSK